MSSHAGPKGRFGVVIPGLLLVVGCASQPAPTTTAGAPGNTGGADLSEAVDEGDVARVRDLVDQRVDLGEPVVLGLTPLMRAANRNHVEIAEVLIEGGADLHDTGMGGLNATHVAARADATETLDALLIAGADPTVRSAEGLNAFEHAAQAGAVGALELLADETDIDIDAPSEVTTQGHGYPRDVGPTPLALAVGAGQLAAVEALLDLGADVDGPSESGHTPLLVAVFTDQPVELVEVLLDAGADVGVTADCEFGCSLPGGEDVALSAAEWAEELGRTEMMDLLTAA